MNEYRTTNIDKILEEVLIEHVSYSPDGSMVLLCGCGNWHCSADNENVWELHAAHIRSFIIENMYDNGFAIVSTRYRKIAAPIVTRQPDQNEVQQIAQNIREEVGNWMLGELSLTGIRDVISDVHRPFWEMTREQQNELTDAVYQELFG